MSHIDALKDEQWAQRRNDRTRQRIGLFADCPEEIGVVLKTAEDCKREREAHFNRMASADQLALQRIQRRKEALAELGVDCESVFEKEFGTRPKSIHYEADFWHDQCIRRGLPTFMEVA